MTQNGHDDIRFVIVKKYRCNSHVMKTLTGVVRTVQLIISFQEKWQEPFVKSPRQEVIPFSPYAPLSLAAEALAT